MGDRSSSRVGVVRSRAVARRSRTNLVIARRVLDGLVAGRGPRHILAELTGHMQSKLEPLAKALAATLAQKAADRDPMRQ